MAILGQPVKTRPHTFGDGFVLIEVDEKGAGMKNRNVFNMVSAVMICAGTVYAQESLTITTYYPSPYGVYDQLEAYRAAVGDVNGDGNIDAADIPATPGSLAVARYLSVNVVIPKAVALNVGGQLAAWDDQGAVLLGSDTSSAHVELREPDNTGTPYIDFTDDDSLDYRARIILQDPGNLLVQGTNLAVADGNSSNRKLYVDGTIGCSDAQAGATKQVYDIAEVMPVTGHVAEGDTVVLDPAKDRQLLKSARAYDTLVVGVISSESSQAKSRGIFFIGDKKLSEDGTGIPHAFVSIAGQVAVNVCLENGPIKPGDLLVTSSVPGCAMKGTDKDKMTGAVVGKAMEHFDGRNASGKKDKGQIIALLMLR
ncbi:MAG: hypothetical protein PHC33_00640 [Candidatus Omnitrophica bacterium]|nr:hypothetical protein [Candidatus Omnitrophota bacterium]